MNDTEYLWRSLRGVGKKVIELRTVAWAWGEMKNLRVDWSVVRFSEKRDGIKRSKCFMAE